MSDNDVDFEFPEDEWDYYLKLMNELHQIGHQMIQATDPEEQARLLKHYTNLQAWMEEIHPTNAWNKD
jgi:hypothetical protein